MSQELNEMITKLFYAIVVAIVTFAYRAISGYFKDRQLMELFDQTVDTVVKALEQTKAKSQRNGEGRVSIELGSNLKTEAISAVKATLGKERLKRLNQLTGERDIDAVISTAIEAKVLTTPNSSKLVIQEQQKEESK